MNLSKSDFKILVTDDSRLSRQVITSVLQEEGYSIVGQSHSAEDAFLKAQKEDYHLFIIDVIMPETSGLDLARSISEIPTPKCILMTSSLNSEGAVIEPFQMGPMTFYINPSRKKSFCYL